MKIAIKMNGDIEIEFHFSDGASWSSPFLLALMKGGIRESKESLWTVCRCSRLALRDGFLLNGGMRVTEQDESIFEMEKRRRRSKNFFFCYFPNISNCDRWKSVKFVISLNVCFIENKTKKAFQQTRCSTDERKTKQWNHHEFLGRADNVFVSRLFTLLENCAGSWWKGSVHQATFALVQRTSRRMHKGRQSKAVKARSSMKCGNEIKY